MTAGMVGKEQLWADLPAEWPTPLDPGIRDRIKDSGRKVVVLDDDPTGTQTVHGVPVLTEWTVASLTTELARDLPCFYILTNSRSLPLPQAQAMNREIATNLVEASQRSRRDFVVVSRSDSTLRGHYPGETDTLAEVLGGIFDATLIIPFFAEGGRYTIGDVHYVAEGDDLIPAGETPFARDAVFGYHNSNLRRWVEEKTEGRVSAAMVASISIADLRLGGPPQVVDTLGALASGSICIVNAATYRDLEVFVSGLLDAESHGKRFLYRTAASFVRVRAGITPRALLAPSELGLAGQGGGLFVVGSYVPKTTSQVETLLNQTAVVPVEMDVEALLEDARQEAEVMRAGQAVAVALAAGKDVLVFTSRKLVTGDSAEGNLSIGQRVSDSLVALVRGLSVRPRFLLAKGGITSSDVATRGLGIKRGMVLGQILPGVPVWQCGDESRYPGLTYIVFPGNVGDAYALVNVHKLGREIAS